MALDMLDTVNVLWALLQSARKPGCYGWTGMLACSPVLKCWVKSTASPQFQLVLCLEEPVEVVGGRGCIMGTEWLAGCHGGQ